MSNVAIITDTHFGARGDSLHMQASMKKFYENIFFPALDQYEVHRVLHGGDYVDRRKFINYQTAEFIRETYRKPLRYRNIREDIIVGNHDIFYRNSTELSAVQQLSGKDWDLCHYNKPYELDLYGVGVLLLPWITDNNREASEKAIATSGCKVVLGHLEISGFQMYRGMPHVGGMDASVFERFGLVMSGHFHHRSENGPIRYLGAPYPMIWSDYRDPRGFHILNTNTLELTFIENPHSIFARIVYDDANKKHDYIKELVQTISVPDSPYHDAYVKVVVQSKTQPFWFDLMMDALYKVNAQDIVVVDDIIVNDDESESELPTQDMDTLSIMREYVDSLTISCDKEELKRYLQGKYQEALVQSQSVRFA